MRLTSTSSLIPVAAALLLAGGCATSEEWRVWSENRSHFASASHWAFSRHAATSVPPVIAEQDLATAGDERWWGAPVSDALPVDISGRWSGSWSGYGLLNSRRTSTALAEFTRDGSTVRGRLVLDDVAAAEAPLAVRLAGVSGVPVVVGARGSRIVVRHLLGSRVFLAVFRVDGDRMIGVVSPPQDSIRIVMTREPRGGSISRDLAAAGGRRARRRARAREAGGAGHAAPSGPVTAAPASRPRPPARPAGRGP